MIDREEMLEFAREFQLEPNVIEKDYALGWLLAGIGNHPVLRDAWVFKGGTCLKKCFFETYRFSEDLDFTVRDPAHLDVGVAFRNVVRYIIGLLLLYYPTFIKYMELSWIPT